MAGAGLSGFAPREAFYGISRDRAGLSWRKGLATSVTLFGLRFVGDFSFHSASTPPPPTTNIDYSTHVPETLDIIDSDDIVYDDLHGLCSERHK